MTNERFIAGDWGTTRLRLSLYEGDRIVETRTGPGIGALTASPADTARSLVEPWIARHGPVPLVLCGMVGSRNGWKEVPYVPCPAGADSLRSALLSFEHEGMKVAIVPGMSCRNRLGAPDVMRGEETQIIGALALRPELARRRHLLCLPGTHTKWVSLEDGVIRDFLTALTGETFALLRDHSMLAKAAAAGSGDPAASAVSFERGLELQSTVPPAPLLHSLFGTRSRQLIEGASREWALQFLSGLLIGADVAGAIEVFGSAGSSSTVSSSVVPSFAGPVALVGDPLLTDLYARALRARGIEALQLDGSECSLAGLRSLVRND